jgi:hypothetical protein
MVLGIVRGEAGPGRWKALKTKLDQNVFRAALYDTGLQGVQLFHHVNISGFFLLPLESKESATISALLFHPELARSSQRELDAAIQIKNIYR